MVLNFMNFFFDLPLSKKKRKEKKGKDKTKHTPPQKKNTNKKKTNKKGGFFNTYKRYKKFKLMLQ